MSKLGKRKIVAAELADADSEAKQKNGNSKAGSNANDDENSQDKNDTASLVSENSSQRLGGGKRRKASNKAAANFAVEASESEDSEEPPLNGSKNASSSSSTAAKKPRKGGKSKGKAAGKSANNKKSKSVESDDEKEDEEDDGIDDNEIEYEVEAIVGHKIIRNALHFCVRWKGYTQDEDTWELESDLNCDALIAEYRKKVDINDSPSKPKGKKGAGGKSPSSAGRGRPSGQKQSKPNADSSDPDKEWAVERIVSCVEDDEHGILYRIRWKGFGAKDDTWEPESNLSCHSLIEKFKKGLELEVNVDAKHLRESPKKTKRLVNETTPRSNLHNRIGRSSKRSAAKNRYQDCVP
ncbi:M-phase phosphoprotein 8 isoform X2 [Scaptodrosophila lebanonensis]|uniref:M-phase phosphoprotein 8 isoform X2 n=1 Tax=Drosophila lebanonensis TaxID=7225 RepID=A0A6J2TZX7_DROLE|nr:M-phase phosphoprotein 8 isoform X2 [Scaptodrosophila lebanonensis]